MEPLVIAAFCTILQNSAPTQETVFSHHPPAMCKIVQNYAKLPVQHHFSTIQDLHVAVLAFKPFLLSPHACGPHATPCNLWKLIQGSLTPRLPLDYLNAHLTMPWNCQSLQHIAAYCSILHQSKNSFLSPSSREVQNSAKLPAQHHFSTIQDLQAAVLAFKPFLLSPHACGPHATSCNLWKLIPGSLTTRQPLDYLNAHLPMLWNY